MNIYTTIPMLKKLWFNKAIRRWKWYTYFEYFVIIWIAFIWVMIYLDTSIFLITKIILIIITAKLWFLIISKYEDLSFFQSMRLVYSYYLAPKLYMNLTNWLQYNQKEIEVDMQWEEMLRNPERKVIVWWQIKTVKKIKKIDEIKKTSTTEKIVKIENDKQKIEIIEEKEKKKINEENKIKTINNSSENNSSEIKQTKTIKRIRRL